MSISRKTLWLEFVLIIMLMLVGLITTSLTFKALGYEATYIQMNPQGQPEEVTYQIPAIFKPYHGEVIQADPFFGTSFTGIETPSLLEGANAGRNFNTLVWSVLTGLTLYGLLRATLKERLSKVLGKMIERGLADERG